MFKDKVIVESGEEYVVKCRERESKSPVHRHKNYNIEI